MVDHPTLFISDQPLRIGAGFNFEPIIKTLWEFIHSAPDDAPLNICVTGGWGSGKTTLLQGLEKAFEDKVDIGQDDKDQQYVTVWFDPWKLSNEQEIRNALTRKILDVIERDAPFVSGAKIGIDRRNVLRVLSDRLLGVGPDDVSTFYKAEARTHDTFVEVEDIFRRIAEVYLNDADRRRRLVVFIDDLDRCRPTTVTRVLESVKLFFNLSGLIFIFALDPDQLERSVAAEYGFEQQEAKEYLEKIFQLTVPLPRKGTKDLGDFLDSKLSEISVELGNKDLSAAIVNRFGRNLRNLKLFINSFSFQRQLIKDRSIHEEALFKWLYLEATMGRSLTAAAPGGLQEFVLALEFLANGSFLHDEGLQTEYIARLHNSAFNYPALIAYAIASQQSKVPLEPSNLNLEQRKIVDALQADGAVVQTLKVVREGNLRLIDSDLGSMIYLTRRDDVKVAAEGRRQPEDPDKEVVALNWGSLFSDKEWEQLGDKLRRERDMPNAYLCYLMANLITTRSEIHECDLAGALRNMGRIEAAKELLSRTLARNPRSAYTVGQMALLYDVTLADEATGSLLYRHAIACGGESAAISSNLASNFFKNQEYEKAYLACLAAYVKDPTDQTKKERLERYASQAGRDEQMAEQTIESLRDELRNAEATGRYPWPLSDDEEQRVQHYLFDSIDQDAAAAELSRLPF
jgi:KAP family P-loop domain